MDEEKDFLWRPEEGEDEGTSDGEPEGAQDARMEDEFDLVEAVRAGQGAGEGLDEAPDLKLGGYMAEHDRPTAFEGSDGQPYTVDVAVEASEDPDRPYVSFLVFVRWAATGGGIMEHVESGDIGFGRTEEEARQGALDLSLYEVKAELDAAIARRRADLED